MAKVTLRQEAINDFSDIWLLYIAQVVRKT
jgi:hypothetical protein